MAYTDEQWKNDISDLARIRAVMDILKNVTPGCSDVVNDKDSAAVWIILVKWETELTAKLDNDSMEKGNENSGNDRRDQVEGDQEEPETPRD